MSALALDSDDEEYETAVLAAAVVVMGAENARLHRAETRLPSHRYLCRPQLLPEPRCDMPWQVLYASRNDRTYITTMGINTETFDYILSKGFRQRWEQSTIPCTDANPNGLPRLGRRSLNAEGALGLICHHLCSSMSDTALQQIFALVPSTVSRYRNFAQTILCATLRQVPEAEIAWWKTAEECEMDSEMVRLRHPLLESAMGTIDGLNLAMAMSDGPELENATFNGWLHGHFTSCVLVFAPRGLIKACVLNAPGSWHDAKVARPIYDKLRNKTPDSYYFVADTAFPRGDASIAGRIQAPLKSGQQVPGDREEREAVLARNRQLLSFRQTAEWGMRLLRVGFARLRLPLDINDPEGRVELLEVCYCLCNLRTELVGINEICTDGEIWADFENVLFCDLQQCDRVA
ncbi:hypothetical protein FKP32DRAFT_1614166 [Trametes sanguinea]|nr:hypothetical protein FKP32DRAFT_1614166 [Trametes sanguinea]